jgi:hypothetical protein
MKNEVITLGSVSHDGKRHQSGLVVFRGGVCPTLYAVSWKDPVKTIRKIKKPT